MAKVIRKGVRVRYVGSDKWLKEAWGNSVRTVARRSGDSAVGFFPMAFWDGEVRGCLYAIPVRDLEIVDR